MIRFVLGRRDAPTDAVSAYAEAVAAALRSQGRAAQTERVDWTSGRRAAVAGLARRAAAWAGDTAVLQYTALQWSARGFPGFSLRVLEALRRAHVRTAVTFHDPVPFAGRSGVSSARRLADVARRASQRYVMRALWVRSAARIVTVDARALSWPPPLPEAAVIPVGPGVGPIRSTASQNGARTVAVFALSGASALAREVNDLAAILSGAARSVPGIAADVFGRNAEQGGPELARLLTDARVPVTWSGVVSESDGAARLANAAAVLFVRGQATAGRSSVVAAIASGTPVVAWSGRFTGPPLTDAGVAMAPAGDRAGAAAALVRVLQDRALNESMRERNAAAYRRYFSWDAIATRYREVLGV